MSRRNENWLLVEWSGGGRDVVHVKAVLNPSIIDLKVGEVLTVLDRRGEPQTSTLIGRAKERDQLLNWKPIEEVAGPSPKPDDEPRDFSPSGESSWEPSDEDASADSEQESCKKIKLEHCRRQYINRRSSKKVLTPSHRANAVIPKIMQSSHSKNNENKRKRSHNGTNRNTSIHKSLPDSTKRNNTSDVNRQMVSIDVRELTEISNSFRVLFKMIEELKRPMTNSQQPHLYNEENISQVNIPQANNTVIQAVEECEETEAFVQEEEFNRSNDNVLITNRYDNQYNASMNNQVETPCVQPVTNAGQDEWVPIGSGKTLIHIEQFRKVNWKSFTVATRTLLLAVFPRRILATHSLTGKPSPAFLYRPAKMCLDPKIISDVIMEIMDRFDVKENLVRGIITTKCADECKMWKQRVKKKKLSQSRSSSNHELELGAKGSFDKSNQTIG